MPIICNKEENIFVIQTKNSSYVIEKNKDNSLTEVYWGTRVSRVEDFPTADEVIDIYYDADRESRCQVRCEYCSWGNRFYREPCIKVTFDDGVRDCELRYDAHKISDDKNELTLFLTDTHYKISVRLIYRIYPDLDFIDKRAIVKNTGDKPITVENLMSGCVYLPDNREYYKTILSTSWAKEYTIERTPVEYGKTVIESRSLYSNSSYYPYFAIDDGRATEDSGEVWFGAVRWSGNYKLCIERLRSSPVYITAGLNDFDFSYPLESGDEIDSPVFTVGYTKEGFGAASRMFHTLQREYLLPKKFADKPLPVLYNAYAALGFDISAEKLLPLAEKAADLGVEMFVIDDGWFENRNDDTGGLGDWQTDKVKFPNGLGEVIDKVNGLGMKFGIWIEPEMVSLDSKLYREHPNWIFGFDNREKELSRSQLTLNLAKTEVKDYIIKILDDLLSNNNIEYLKWDSNRLVSQVGWHDAPIEKQRTYQYKYIKNLYEIFDFINKKFPNVIIENCASGGWRADLSMSEYCSRINRSDNQDPRDEIFLHEGFTLVNMSKLAGGGGHIHKSPNYINNRYAPLQFKAYAGMLGSLAIGYDLNDIDDDEYGRIKEYVAMHKKQRHIIQNGTMYKIASPRENNYAVYSYVSEDKSEALMFVFGLNISFREKLPFLKFKGLDGGAVYEIENGHRMSGEGLMNVGVYTDLSGDYDSKRIYIKKI